MIGSPYAIDRYEPAPAIASWDELARLRQQLNRRGMKLILDFVPNHFHAETSLIGEHPYLFLTGTEALLREDPQTFYRYGGKVWAHGRDPYFPAWQDTIQVDYFSNRARDFMIDRLLDIASVCDGVRCDMAMLLLNSVFASTWRHTAGFEDRHTEFWERAIKRIKQQFPDFQFIAEAYWDLEWQLQQLGFDYTYDKRLLDRLREGNVSSVRGHLFADPDFRDRSVRFLENHDEDRILRHMNTRQAEAAAVITYTLPGMRFFHEGQWEGKRVRLPVQLGREPEERACTCVQAGFLPAPAPELARPVCKCTFAFYEKLMALLRRPILRSGRWEQLEVLSGADQVLAWHWTLERERLTVIVNFSNHAAAGTLPPPVRGGATLNVSEPWRALSYEQPASLPLEVTMYPYEYRILEYVLHER